ncbi:SAM-dependent methyltransferase [Hahella sp. CCB-MM4]|uniref:SAM-dependent methyltransferase n=1 Tax=Hahella sp. (strain CCB-MM4) TaxID=1926491 RepID=UPI000B9B48B4|nr:cyclopropane-fatty-acyl-phospholipid synthase family protein [Hahella sp. CCB-MM4]OZG75319.1 SAM-dependent methyltransferase [Hahella sp. CCB-MM4]
MNMIQWAERGWVPDSLIRFGIRRLCQERLRDESKAVRNSGGVSFQKRLDNLRASPIAIETQAANQQHYEVPAAFYQLVLGDYLKYSSCYWSEDVTCLTDAERAMLRLYCERAELEDGQSILELGCGWGSLSLWMAEQYPGASITAVSNSHSQRQFIEEQARQRQIDNLRVITCDVNQLTLDQRFDRVVSVEMFEHVRNYRELFEHISGWLKDDGKLFVHIFCHRQLLYPFETEGEKNWMGRYFFTGGQMPSADTFRHFQEHVHLEKQWYLPGTHYQKTAEAWLENMDNNRLEVLKVFTDTYGSEQAEMWVQRWRMFFMACAELFGYKEGREWMVCHYLFNRQNASVQPTNESA